MARHESGNTRKRAVQSLWNSEQSYFHESVHSRNEFDWWSGDKIQEDGTSMSREQESSTLHWGENWAEHKLQSTRWKADSHRWVPD